MRIAFVSRHAPTPDQLRIVAELQLAEPATLTAVGDLDAFSEGMMDRLMGLREDGYECVVAVHPWIVLGALSLGLAIGVFENANRAPEGAKPEFTAKSLHVLFDLGDM